MRPTFDWRRADLNGRWNYNCFVKSKSLPNEIVLVDQEVGRSTVGSGRKADCQHCRPPIPAAQLALHRSEVGISRKDDEFVVASFVLQQIDDIQDHMDVGAGFALTSQRWTINDLETRKIERGTKPLICL